MKKITLFLLALGMTISFNANAWFFFFFPIPSGWPDALSNQAKKMAESKQTKALAYVGEDKTFGQKYYVWGNYLGDLPQNEANKIALDRCNAGLARAKAETNGGLPRWDFGDKKCELYGFPNEPATAEMPKADEVVIETKPAIEVKPAETFATPVKPASPPAAAATPKPSEVKPSAAMPLAQPLTASEGAKRLLELKSLLDQGVITQQDYDSKKAQILKSM